MRPLEDKVTRLCTIPGVDRVTAWGMLAEMGMNMNQFPSSGHLASWACLCPGSFESAGKRSEEHTSELQSRQYLVCRLLLEKKKNMTPPLVRTMLPATVLLRLDPVLV